MLPELIRRLAPGEEALITEDGQRVARIVAVTSGQNPRKPRELGTMRGTVLHVARDFDEPLDDFQDLME